MPEKKIIKKPLVKKPLVKKPLVKKSVKKTLVKKVPALSVSKKKSLTKKELKETEKTGRQYYEAVGRRKRSIARVRLFTCKPFEGEKGKLIINEKKYTDFFTTFDLREIILSPLKKMKSINRFEVTIKVKGGGINGQAGAIVHGISRALVKFNPDFSKKLKRSGFLTRDSREKERKKPGLKKARKASQWKKR